MEFDMSAKNVLGLMESWFAGSTDPNDEMGVAVDVDKGSLIIDFGGTYRLDHGKVQVTTNLPESMGGNTAVEIDGSGCFTEVPSAKP